MKMNKVVVTFTQKESGKTLVISCVSHFTCVFGKESGEGKSEFFSVVEEGIADGSVTISVEPKMNFTVATPATLEAILRNEDRQVIFIDESSVLQSSLLKKINKSKHVFINITRSMPLRGDYPLQGIYFLKRHDSWFELEKDESLKFMDKDSVYSEVIVESSKGRSEHEFLSQYLCNVTAANGRNNVEKLLRNTSGKILVFVDLANIGRVYSLLVKRCKQNPEIRFYNYQSFEELLFYSKLIQEMSCNIEESFLDFLSIEQFYEKTLEKITKGTVLEYKHGKSLAAPFLEKRNLDNILDSEVGRTLLYYLQKNKEGTAKQLTKSDIF